MKLTNLIVITIFVALKILLMEFLHILYLLLMSHLIIKNRLLLVQLLIQMDVFVI